MTFENSGTGFNFQAGFQFKEKKETRNKLAKKMWNELISKTTGRADMVPDDLREQINVKSTLGHRVTFSLPLTKTATVQSIKDSLSAAIEEVWKALPSSLFASAKTPVYEIEEEQYSRGQEGGWEDGVGITINVNPTAGGDDLGGTEMRGLFINPHRSIIVEPNPEGIFPIRTVRFVEMFKPNGCPLEIEVYNSNGVHLVLELVKKLKPK
jgi:hypothetical protein